MTTSGTYTFEPTVAAFTDEAFERIGKDPATLTARHLQSARMSLSFMLADWATRGIKLWAIEADTQTVTASDVDYTLDTNTVDIFDVVLRRDNVDNQMLRLGRNDYQMIPTKSTTGRPSQFYLDRQRAAPVLYLWPSPENSTDVVRFNKLRRLQDVGSATATADIPYLWFEAFAAGLAAKLAEKYAKALERDMIAKAAVALDNAMEESRERASTYIQVGY